MCEHVLEAFQQRHNIENDTELASVWNDEADFHKLIFRVDTAENGSFVIKLHHSKPMQTAIIEEQSRFSEKLRHEGINTAERFSVSNDFCHTIQLRGKLFNATLERYVGEEVKVIDEKMVKSMAELMAQMHICSEVHDLHLSTGTIWDMLSQSADISRGYAYFKSLKDMPIKKSAKFDQLIYQDITNQYDKRLWALEKVQLKLPTFAVQGDFSTNNMTNSDKGLSIFDYNIAGDEALICDAVIQGLFISREMDLKSGLKEADRSMLFDTFMSTYQKNRPISRVEREIMNDVYALANSFWFTPILFSDDSLKQRVDAGDVYAVNHLMDAIWQQLMTDKFS
jgi:Ser/Thr protein kinase RdoA (MazF antagonist)